MVKFAETFMVYAVVPLTLFFAITMSFLIQDILALFISTIGTMIIMFTMGKGHS